MSMPFSPCDAAQCDDKYVSILSHVFGPVIDKMVAGESLNGADASTNIIATMISYFNSGVLTVASVIITYVAIIGIANTANDGEVLGAKWSTLWTPLRAVVGTVMLVPTSSGYSLIQLIVFMIALWGSGLGNTIYRAGMATSVFSPNAIVADVNKTGEFYGLKNFAFNYALSKQCIRLIDSVYENSTTSKPRVNIASTPDSSRLIGKGMREDKYIFKDRNPESNLGGGGQICGSFTLISYDNQGSKSKFADAVSNIDVTITGVKKEEIAELMKDINQWVEKWPKTKVDADWSVVNSAEFLSILNKHENNLATRLQQIALNKTGGIHEAIHAFEDTLTSQGWAMAAGWFQRVGTARQGLSKSFGMQVAQAMPPSFSLRALSTETNEVANILGAIQTGLQKGLDLKEAKISKADKPSFSDLEKYFPKGKNEPTFEMYSSLVSGLNSAVSSAMQIVISGMVASDSTGKTPFCGSNGEMGGSLNRIKCVGDYIVSVESAVSGIKSGFQLATHAFMLIAGGAQAIPIVQYLTDVGPLLTSVGHTSDWIVSVIADIIFWLKAMAFYFSVLLPSLPYIAFMVVVVGNVLAVAQTIIVAPLWAMMHTRPDNSFIGQDRQGYLMLLSLFVRPALAVLGLFIACLIADPVIDFVASAFFEMREALMKGSGFVGIISNFNTYVWWIACFGLTLLPILYMIFFLPQTLPDEILRWLGGGLNSLGDSSAVGLVQTGLATIYGKQAAQGTSPGKFNPTSKRNPPGSSNPSQSPRNGGGSGGSGGSLLNGQGVSPSGSGGGGGVRSNPPTYNIGMAAGKGERNAASHNASTSYVQRFVQHHPANNKDTLPKGLPSPNSNSSANNGRT